MKYLKDERHYSDLYDLFTIKACLLLEQFFYKEGKALKKIKGKKEDKIKGFNMAYNTSLYSKKGERFRRKKETIEKWMQDDAKKDKKLKSASVPSNILCDNCMEEMKPASKEFYHDYTRILFFFECPECKKRKGVFDNGEEFKHKTSHCPECSDKLEEKTSRKNGRIATSFICKNCGYKKKEVIDFEKDNKKWEERQSKDRELLKKYRSRYCLTDKEGKEYIASIERMKQLTGFVEKIEKEDKNPLYQKAKKLKKLKVSTLRKKLEKTLKKEGFENLQFDKAEMGKYVIVPFSLDDAKDKRKEYDSKTICRRTIQKTLEKTNWRLMSDGTHYRLGILSGRLKAYEQEQDLMKLAEKLDG